MGIKEEEQTRVGYRIQQEEPEDLPKKVAVGIIGIMVLFALPTIMEVAAGGKPWRR